MESYPPARFTLLKRRPDLTRDEFNTHWHGVHGTLLPSLPDFRRSHYRYIQNHLLPIPASLEQKLPQERRWDGIAQTFQNVYETGVIDFFDQPDFPNLVRPDEEKFLDYAASTTTYTTQRVIKDGPVRGVKYLVFLRSADGLNQDEFSDYWFNKHAPLLKEIKPFWSRVTRYCQYHARPELFRGSSEMSPSDAFAGVAEIYFDSIEDLEAALNDPEYVSVAHPDAKNFLKGPSLHFIIEDYPMLDSEAVFS